MSTRFAIGAKHWPGISKLIEEAGEVTQVAGKLLGTYGDAAHWDGTDLRARLVLELGDLLAAIDFVIEANGLERVHVEARRSEKFSQFCAWHRAQRGG